MISILVVAILVFAVLLLNTSRREEAGRFGFSAATVLAYCASLLFVLIISHVSLREKIEAYGIMYLEYFYFVMYFAILVVSVNSILFASRIKIKLVQYRDNLIVKLLYWPAISLLLLIATILEFY